MISETASYNGDNMNMPVMLIRKLFKSHGEFCASQPWEVIVATLIFLVCVLTMAGKEQIEESVTTAAVNAGNSMCSVEKSINCGAGNDFNPTSSDSTSMLETTVITLVRVLAVLHCYYRFKKIHRIGSTLLLKIAALYLVFTLCFFTLVIISLGNRLKSINDPGFLILLLIDMPKVTRMAQFALSSSHNRRIGENLAHGMFVLAPTFTLDSIAKVLLMGVGFLTGIEKLEIYAWYAVVSIMVNFLVYLTFYPAGLSLMLELMYCTDGRPRWDVRQIINTLPKEDGQSPVVHKVRVIATAILVIIHILLRRPMDYSGSETHHAETYFYYPNLGSYQWIYTNAEQVFVIVLVLALAFKYVFYEDMDEASELRKTYIEELTRKFEEDSEQEEKNSSEMDRASNSTDEGISLGSSAKTRQQPRMVIGDDSSSESAWSEVYLPDLKDQEAQTTDSISSSSSSEEEGSESEFSRSENISGPRPLQECIKISKMPNGIHQLTDEEVVQLVEARVIRNHNLETAVENHLRGVEIRRKVMAKQGHMKKAFENLPYKHYDYQLVFGACCENVVGYMPVPVGVVGPLKLDEKLYNIPMATTEGCLVASTNRGCSALRQCGVSSYITDDGMSRAPIVLFPTVARATEAKKWLETPQNFEYIKKHFDSTSRFARLRNLKPRLAGRNIYLRFVAKTGDAMGMNMLSKATEFALEHLKMHFEDMVIVSLSGNMCTDKKPAAINWIDGRGKSVVCEAVVPAEIVETTLKTTTAALVDVNIRKNLIGSAMAGSIGGMNAHAANIVTAIYIATGQDAAQNVGSSNCITLLEPHGPDGRDLYITTTMPSIEVGTVGGGTVLAAQSSCLEMLGIKGSHPTSPGENACQLARIICGTVLAGELSLMSALASGHLVKSHLRHNRSSAQVGQLAATASSGSNSIPPPLVPCLPNVEEKRSSSKCFYNYYSNTDNQTSRVYSQNEDNKSTENSSSSSSTVSTTPSRASTTKVVDIVKKTTPNKDEQLNAKKSK